MVISTAGRAGEKRPSNWDRHRQSVWERDRGICWACGRRVLESQWNLGHIVDWFVGGSNEPDNLTVMCITCNRLKPPHSNIEEARQWQRRGGIWGDLRGSAVIKGLLRYYEESVVKDAILSFFDLPKAGRNEAGLFLALHPPLEVECVNSTKAHVCDDWDTPYACSDCLYRTEALALGDYVEDGASAGWLARKAKEQ